MGVVQTLCGLEVSAEGVAWLGTGLGSLKSQPDPSPVHTVGSGQQSLPLCVAVNSALRPARSCRAALIASRFGGATRFGIAGQAPSHKLWHTRYRRQCWGVDRMSSAISRLTSIVDRGIPMGDEHFEITNSHIRILEKLNGYKGGSSDDA